MNEFNGDYLCSQCSMGIAINPRHFHKDFNLFTKQGTLRQIRRVPCSPSPLFINIHRNAGLEFHSKIVLVDGDLLNQPPGKLFVVFGEGGGLLL